MTTQCPNPVVPRTCGLGGTPVGITFGPTIGATNPAISFCISPAFCPRIDTVCITSPCPPTPGQPLPLCTAIQVRNQSCATLVLTLDAARATGAQPVIVSPGQSVADVATLFPGLTFPQTGRFQLCVQTACASRCRCKRSSSACTTSCQVLLRPCHAYTVAQCGGSITVLETEIVAGTGTASTTTVIGTNGSTMTTTTTTLVPTGCSSC